MKARKMVVRSRLCVLAGVCCAAADFEITRSTIDGGAMRSTGGEFELSGTIGQPDAGPGATGMSGGDFELTGGFWFALFPTDCNEDGVVSLLDHATFESCLLGPSTGVPAGCECFDVNRSGTIDMADFAVMQPTYTGP